MEFENWIAFVLIWTVACFGVGPNSVTCATAGANNGFARGLWSAFGITAASLVHSMIAAFGFSAVFLTYAEAYTILKWLGVAYLCYLGLRLWGKRPTQLTMERGSREGRRVLFRRAFFVSMSNPQPILTYLAFFTPALDPSLPVVPQLAILVPTAVGIVLLMYIAYVLSGTPLRYIVTSIKRQLILNRLTGTFYIGTAAVLATTDSRK